MLILNVAWVLPLLSHCSQVTDIADITCAKDTKPTGALLASPSGRDFHGWAPVWIKAQTWPGIGTHFYADGYKHPVNIPFSSLSLCFRPNCLLSLWGSTLQCQQGTSPGLWILSDQQRPNLGCPQDLCHWNDCFHSTKARAFFFTEVTQKEKRHDPLSCKWGERNCTSKSVNQKKERVNFKGRIHLKALVVIKIPVLLYRVTIPLKTNYI